MKNYINPEIKLSMFHVEKISATDATITELPNSYLLSVPTYSDAVQGAIDSATKSVSANVSFQDAIKFR